MGALTFFASPFPSSFSNSALISFCALVLTSLTPILACSANSLACLTSCCRLSQSTRGIGTLSVVAPVACGASERGEAKMAAETGLRYCERKGQLQPVWWIGMRWRTDSW